MIFSYISIYIEIFEVRIQDPNFRCILSWVTLEVASFEVESFSKMSLSKLGDLEFSRTTLGRSKFSR
jgi:hypothetical protein